MIRDPRRVFELLPIAVVPTTHEIAHLLVLGARFVRVVQSELEPC